MTNKASAKIPFDRSYWVVPGRFLAGYYPGDRQEDLMALKLRGLLDCGIRCVINLMDPDERDHQGHPFADYAPELLRMADGGLPVVCHRMPVRDLDIPTAALMIEILDRVDGVLGEGRSVYVHCWGGRGRTGTVVGCWLARHGIAEGQGALELIRKFRRHDAKAQWPSPETSPQIEMVLAWRQGQ